MRDIFCNIRYLLKIKTKFVIFVHENYIFL